MFESGASLLMALNCLLLIWVNKYASIRGSCYIYNTRAHFLNIISTHFDVFIWVYIAACCCCQVQALALLKRQLFSLIYIYSYTYMNTCRYMYVHIWSVATDLLFFIDVDRSLLLLCVEVQPARASARLPFTFH